MKRTGCIALVLAFVVPSLLACTVDERRNLPANANAAIELVSEDISAGRYDKVYDEAAQEWRDAVDRETNRKRLADVRERLGKVAGRTLHSGREQENASAPLSGHVLEIVYQTTFERGDAMEQITLIERDGRWLLARYSVSSSLLR